MKIDFHTHILPGMDDGAENESVSLQMLEMLKGQGIEIAVLTPHYYRDKNTVEEFLERRNASYNRLLQAAENKDIPEIMTGAEVRMWRDMSREDLLPLCIENTNMILCEMPFDYRDYVIDELEELPFSGYVPVIAHIDRYFKLYPPEKMKRIIDLKCVIYQVNTSALSGMTMRRQLLRMAAENQAVFVLGTDCHGISYRTPDIKARYHNKKSLRGLFMHTVENNEDFFLKEDLAQIHKKS